jgi:hypothetical protein
MQQYRTIDIDFDIHKLIEAERRSFDDPPNAALRRLMKLPAREESSTRPAGRAWSSEGAALPHGSAVRMTYGEQLIEGTIDDGKWLCSGQTFDSPSAAASALALTKDGQTTSLNGWNYWEARLPGSSEWVQIKRLRTHGLGLIRGRKL